MVRAVCVSDTSISGQPVKAGERLLLNDSNFALLKGYGRVREATDQEIREAAQAAINRQKNEQKPQLNRR